MNVVGGARVTRILIADDHEIVRSELNPILEKEATVTAAVTKPDIAVIDYSLPIVNGVEATRQNLARALRKANPACRSNSIGLI